MGRATSARRAPRGLRVALGHDQGCALALLGADRSEDVDRTRPGTKIGPVFQCSQGLAACRAGVAVEAQKNPPHAGRGEWREYWRLR